MGPEASRATASVGRAQADTKGRHTEAHAGTEGPPTQCETRARIPLWNQDQRPKTTGPKSHIKQSCSLVRKRTLLAWHTCRKNIRRGSALHTPSAAGFYPLTGMGVMAKANARSHSEQGDTSPYRRTPVARARSLHWAGNPEARDGAISHTGRPGAASPGPISRPCPGPALPPGPYINHELGRAGRRRGLHRIHE